MKDEVAKRERGYTDKRSIVRPDGSEKLYGKDWTRRKEELWKRCEGRCERKIIVSMMPNVPMERCRSEASEPDHIVKRSKKRDDRLWNLQALCRLHHDLKHPEKNKLHWRKNE